jgi:nitroimidazol reductase NimA-like FMN-containing flavoprotein (pyridoxamine 5'-phosphate oxidase superfamily)
MSDDPADLGSPGGGAPQRQEGGLRPRVLERLDERECLQLIGAGRLGRLAYSGRFGPTVLPVLYKLHEGSVVFRTLQDTFTEEDLRTGIAHAEYEVGFEVDQYDPETLDGWVVLVVGPAHHVDTEAERARIISAGNDPWPEDESEHLVRVQPIRISGRRRRRP